MPNPLDTNTNRIKVVWVFMAIWRAPM